MCEEALLGLPVEAISNFFDSGSPMNPPAPKIRTPLRPLSYTELQPLQRAESGIVAVTLRYDWRDRVGTANKQQRNPSSVQAHVRLKV